MGNVQGEFSCRNLFEFKGTVETSEGNQFGLVHYNSDAYQRFARFLIVHVSFQTAGAGKCDAQQQT